jgi:hypothetical protein
MKAAKSAKSSKMTYGKWVGGCKCGHAHVLQRDMEPVDVTPETERARIIASFAVFKIPAWMQQKVIEALDSDKWNWFEDCDGCTCVSEVYWPTKYFPPCLRHDFDWNTGNGGAESNRLFYELNVAYGMPKTRAGIRWLGVTLAWYFWAKWRQK